MEADFGKRPVPTAHPAATATDSRSEERGPGLDSDGREKVMAGMSDSPHSRTQDSNVPRPQQQETARIPSFSRDTGLPPAGTSLNGIGALNDPLLSQSLGMFASGQNFSPQFFPPIGNSSTGYSLHQPMLQPTLADGDGGNVSGGLSALHDASQQNLSSIGGGRSGTTTPRTLWQLLANFPQQGSLLPSYATEEDFAGDSAANLPHFPLLGAQQHALQSSHLPSDYHHPQQQQNVQPPTGHMANDFLPYNPPSTEPNAAGVLPHGDVTANLTQDRGSDVGKSPLAGPASATPSMGGLMKAITNQIGYLEGDESKPYLKLHYFRVVSPV